MPESEQVSEVLCLKLFIDGCPLPTSAVTLGVPGAAKLPWEKWAGWFLPLPGIVILLAFLLLIPPYLFHRGPF